MALLWAGLIGGARWSRPVAGAGRSTDAGQDSLARTALAAARGRGEIAAPETPRREAMNSGTVRVSETRLTSVTGQFLGVFSFLPSIYEEAGVAKELGALLTAFAVMANVSGNMFSGLLLQRGFQRQTLIAFAGLTMAAMAWLAFGSGAGFGVRYAAVVLFSAVGGLIPGTMFATAPFYAPSTAAVSTTVGLMQQGSGLGQIMLPPVVAALAQYTGDWSSTWIATGIAAMVTVGIAVEIARFDRVRLRRG
ncbi:MAG TPA: hypothetical protein PK177_00740 [Burkholderiaceae bacterium]|nr:hypothetical protein [Burkholderiaceae bacterium]